MHASRPAQLPRVPLTAPLHVAHASLLAPAPAASAHAAGGIAGAGAKPQNSVLYIKALLLLDTLLARLSWGREWAPQVTWRAVGWGDPNRSECIRIFMQMYARLYSEQAKQYKQS